MCECFFPGNNSDFLVFKLKSCYNIFGKGEIMKKKVIGLCAILILTSGCGKIPTLENGQEAIVTFENGDMISVDDFYTMIKDTYGLQTLINMIDTYVLETEFADYLETAEVQADYYVDSYIEMYGGEDALLQQTGYQSLDDVRETLYLSMLQSHAIEEYAKMQITDEQIQEYYDNDVIGDMEISHILVTPNVDEDATDEETDAAEEEAQATIEEIIARLDEASANGEDIATVFGELAAEYSEDEATKDDNGELGRINYGSDLGTEYDELVAAAAELEDGEYSTEVITTELGYHVILKTASYDKESLDDVREEIVDTLAQEYITNNDDTAINALQHYRREYGMEIQDSEINRQYSNYIQNLLLQLQESSDDQ